MTVMMNFLIFILVVSSVAAELQRVFFLGPGDGSGGHVETLEIYYSEDTDPRFVDRDDKSVFPGSSKDNTVIFPLKFEPEQKAFLNFTRQQYSVQLKIF